MIRVPLLNQGTEENKTKYVEVKEDQLPTNVAQIVNFLDKEQASIEYWLEIAVSRSLL